MDSDPVSWLMIEPGWTVVDQEGNEIGRVEEVAGDSSHDIFNGLAIAGGVLSRPRYVPAEQVGPITEGRVQLAITAATFERLGEYEEPAPSEELSAERAGIVRRIETDIAPPRERAGHLPLLRRVLLWFGLAGRR